MKNLLIKVFVGLVAAVAVVSCEQYDADVDYLESKGITDIAITESKDFGECGAKRFWSGYNTVTKQLVSGCI